MIKSKELKTKISHTHSLILSQLIALWLASSSYLLQLAHCCCWCGCVLECNLFKSSHADCSLILSTIVRSQADIQLVKLEIDMRERRWMSRVLTYHCVQFPQLGIGLAMDLRSEHHHLCRPGLDGIKQTSPTGSLIWRAMCYRSVFGQPACDLLCITLQVGVTKYQLEGTMYSKYFVNLLSNSCGIESWFESNYFKELCIRSGWFNAIDCQLLGCRNQRSKRMQLGQSDGRTWPFSASRITYH